MPTVSLDALLNCLALDEVAPGVWSGPQLQMDYRRIFGGQLLAQAVAAATATTPGMAVKSIDVLFPREGSLDGPLELVVDQPNTGRTFATRRTTASQTGEGFVLALVSLHDDAEDGIEHHDTPPDVGTPMDAAPTTIGMIPWEVRVVDAVDLESRDAGPASYSFWMRVADRSLPDDPMVHQALAAHATDLTVIGTALRPHQGYSPADSTVTLHTAVTSHQLWFHRRFRMDDWCLVTQHSPVAAGGRAFGLGHIHTADGALVASFAQESMIRLMPK